MLTIFLKLLHHFIKRSFLKLSLFDNIELKAYYNSLTNSLDIYTYVSFDISLYILNFYLFKYQFF